jgi:hypothetical protein
MRRRTLTGSMRGVIDVLAVQRYLAVEAKAADEIIHAVQAPQHRALPAPRGADESGDRPGSDRQVRVAHGRRAPVVELPDVTVDD